MVDWSAEFFISKRWMLTLIPLLYCLYAYENVVCEWRAFFQSARQYRVCLKTLLPCVSQNFSQRCRTGLISRWRLTRLYSDLAQIWLNRLLCFVCSCDKDCLLSVSELCFLCVAKLPSLWLSIFVVKYRVLYVVPFCTVVIPENWICISHQFFNIPFYDLFKECSVHSF